MRLTFFARYALVIVCVVSFLVPFCLRGARMSVEGMKNEVTDWLPSHIQETTEMKWFWRHFAGERFVIVSWQGCTGAPGDERFQLFLSKLRPEVPPSRRSPPPAMPAAAAAAAADNSTAGSAASSKPRENAEVVGGHAALLERDFDFIGDRLGLFFDGQDHCSFGGRDEKWLRGKNRQWYFITPDGTLYHWSSGNAPLATLGGRVWRWLFGGQIAAEEIAFLGPVDGPWYYADPHRLNAQLFKSVTTGPQVLEGLTRADGGVLADDVGEAQRRLEGALFGPDGVHTCMILTLTEAGRDDLHHILGRGMLGRPRGRLLEIADQCQIAAADLRLGGPPVDNVAIDEEGTITLVRLVSLSVLLGLVLAYSCFRSLTATIIVFFAAGLGAVASVALVGWCGSTMDAILMSMPSLVYVLGISGAVHLINYYREALETDGPAGAPEKAVSLGWKPALLCNVTTSIGLVSLCTSDLTPIRKFGIFSALAVMATLILLFTYLPAALQLFPQKPRSPLQRRRDEQPWYDRYLSRFWERLCGGIIGHHLLVSAACFAVIAAVGYGVTRINTSVNLLKMFDQRAKILSDYAWLEQHLGKLVPMEVVVKVAPEAMLPAPPSTGGGAPAAGARHQLSFLDRMLIVDQIQSVAENVFGDRGQGVAGRSLSAATFALPSSHRYATYSGRLMVNSALQKHRDELLASDYLRIDQQDGSELWRISLRIGALQDIDYGQFVGQLQCAVEPIMAACRAREQILRDLESRPGRRGAARVLLLGAPVDDALLARADAGPADPAAAAGGGLPPSPGATGRVDQTAIFATVLRDLLRAARIDVRYHNPQTGRQPEHWGPIVKQFACVALVRGNPAYALGDLRGHGATVIDLRDHVFHPTSGTTPAAAAIATAATAHAAHAARGGSDRQPDVTAVYTGVVPIVYKAQRTLLQSLIASTFWSFITITPLMMLVSRGFGAGLVVMLPNVLPVLVIFGGMGWLDIPVDIGSMMAASIALGVAVDDTIHFLTWFRRALDSLGDRKLAIMAAYKHCATPTFQAALISGLGLSIFAFSTFTPTQRFGYLMLTILFAGVAAELIFMPALLASPLGRVFRPRGTVSPASPASCHADPHALGGCVEQLRSVTPPGGLR